MNSLSKFHRLSLRGKAGVTMAILASGIFYAGKILVDGFASGEGGIAFLPISFFEIILAGILSAGILISYFILVRINKKRLKNRTSWSQNARSIRIQFFIYNLLGLLCVFLLLHFGKIKWIIPLLLFLFAGFAFNIRKKTIGNSAVLTFLAIIASLLSFYFDKFQFEIGITYFSVGILLYSLWPFKS